MVRAEATAKYVRTSAQKAGLVLDLIRNKDVNQALSALQFSRKSVARDVARLFVSKCHANNGPSQKRVRPAPMGRAFRIVKRTTHLTVEVTERAQVIKAVGATESDKGSAKKANPGAKSKRGKAGQPAAAAAV